MEMGAHTKKGKYVGTFLDTGPYNKKQHFLVEYLIVGIPFSGIIADSCNLLESLGSLQYGNLGYYSDRGEFVLNSNECEY